MWTSVDYELDWPRELLWSELRSLRHGRYRVGSSFNIELLLTEAFHTDVPVEDYRQFSSAGEWEGDAGPGRKWVDDLLGNIDQLRMYTPRPYWTARRTLPNRGVTSNPRSPDQCFAELIADFHARGYLARDFGEPCVDGGSDVDAARDLDAELRDRLGGSADQRLWPLHPDTWDIDTFYSLIEVFHDLVARPRHRWVHEHGGCGWHFEDFDTQAGRRVYRALVNRTLAESGVELQLADDGEDVGRLVHVVDEARGDLITQVTGASDLETAGRIEHAISLFRRRGASKEDKRSAIVAVAGILEDRRKIIKETAVLTKKDEGALFDIANNFALRHHNSNQKTDYDPIFLDWIFWWYLATVELTHRLLARKTDKEV